MFYSTKIGPFYEITSITEDKNMLYNIFLDLHQKFRLLNNTKTFRLA